MDCIDDIVAWSSDKLSAWKRDALRRLACNNTLTQSDRDELLAMVKKQAGFACEAPVPIDLARQHFTAQDSTSPFYLKKIHKVKNVNRLVPAAELDFSPTGLTIIYGRNGSGKSGFVRIFRTACRSRIENLAKLKVLGDVYETTSLPLEAEILIDRSGIEVPIQWQNGVSTSHELSQVAVFDAAAAQIYVDSGHHIQFLPFGLALPHKLNELCLVLKTSIEEEKKVITEKLALLTMGFAETRTTKAQVFYSELSAKTTSPEIATASDFSTDDQARLDELNRLLRVPETSAIDLNGVATWASQLATRSQELTDALSDERLNAYRQLRQKAAEARQLADLSADDLFKNEPLPGVGADAWRTLWLAAREYSTKAAYLEQEFPVVSDSGMEEHCVLCQQTLSNEASARLLNFSAFMTGALASNATGAEGKLAQCVEALPSLSLFDAEDWTAKSAHLIERQADLGARVLDFKVQIIARYNYAMALLRGVNAIETDLDPLVPISGPLSTMSTTLEREATTLSSLSQNSERQKLIAEKSELEDRKTLNLSADSLKNKADLLADDALYVKALAEVQTTAITKKANDLIDLYLTKEVVQAFDRERSGLEISGLKIAISRKSDQKKASFQTETGSELVKNSSEILSEGEQRALALAGFFTEISISEGKGPIVIDDPVSSLDRDRGARVAKRIAQEAQNRQVVVFTHDIIFFNELCKAADASNIVTKSVALFSDAKNAGKIDLSGIGWKGLAVSRRLIKIKAKFVEIEPVYGTSPSDYEFEIKNLYGRLRDTYERLVEEHIFHDIVRRGADAVQTLKLRRVHLSDALAIRFHEGMTKANTHSHDNPAADTVLVPPPLEFQSDLHFIETLISDLTTEAAATEKRRPSMNPFAPTN